MIFAELHHYIKARGFACACWGHPRPRIQLEKEKWRDRERDQEGDLGGKVANGS